MCMVVPPASAAAWKNIMRSHDHVIHAAWKNIMRSHNHVIHGGVPKTLLDVPLIMLEMLTKLFYMRFGLLHVRAVCTFMDT